MSSIDYKINSATLEDIQLHLEKCNTQFSPALSTYVNIEDYTKKIKLNATLFEAWKEDELIGLIACYLNDQNKKNGYITNVSVLQSEQGKGISTTLLKQTLQESQDRGFETVTLEVNISNIYAINLYKKYNFYFSERIGHKQKMISRLNDSNNVMVSICCITYNHVKYLRQAIDSFLMQKTTFPIEILIHDDASSDGTVDIIKEYETKHPEIIKPIYQKDNQHSRGVSISSTYNFPRSRGKYLSLCEGDDYWTDPYKLQKQVDFLEKNANYSAATHQSQIIFEDSDAPSKMFNEHGLSTICTIDILKGRLFHTASLTFRSEIIKKHTLPNNITSGDRALNFLISSFGKIHYSKESMCIYRKSSSGISSSVTMEYMERDLKMIPWIKKINKNFPTKKYASFIHYTILEYPKLITKQKLIKHSLMITWNLIMQLPSSYKLLKKFLRHDVKRYWRKAQLNKTI